MNPLPTVTPASLAPALITAALRWGGTVVAGVLIQHSWATNDQKDMITGVVVGIGTLGWSAYQKWLTSRRLAVAQASMGTAAPAVPK